MMLLGDVLLCAPVVTAPREKAGLWVCCLRQTTLVEDGAAAYHDASVNRDGERLAIR